MSNEVRKMTDIKKSIELINASGSLSDAAVREVLPEPCADNGYYFVYYPAKLYKEAFCDIVTLAGEGLRLWYDRKQEHGEAWEEYMLDKVSRYYCTGVVFYLSPEAFADPFFFKLCAAVDAAKKSYCSVNFTAKEDGSVLAGADISETAALPDDRRKLIRKLFSNTITFIPGGASIEEKSRGIKLLKPDDVLVYAVENGEAIVTSVKDLFMETIKIPKEAEIDGKLYPVTKIAALSFANCRLLNTIEFPETIREIGASIIQSNIQDAEFHLPAIVDFLAILGITTPPPKCGEVFLNCISLKKICLPQSLQRIHDLTFYGCPNLESVNLGGVIYCSPKAFADISPLMSGNKALNESYPPVKELICPPSIIKHDDKFFSTGAYSAIFIPPTVTTITGYSELTVHDDITLAEGTEDTAELFVNNQTVEKLSIPSTFAPESTSEFAFCQNLQEVRFAKHVMHAGIHKNALNIFTFVGCKNLKKVVLPENLPYLTLTSFLGCQNLNELSIPNATTFIVHLRSFAIKLIKNIYKLFLKFKHARPPYVLRSLFDLDSSHKIKHEVYINTLTLKTAAPIILAKSKRWCMKKIMSGLNTDLAEIYRNRVLKACLFALYKLIFSIILRTLRFYKSIPSLHTIYLAEDNNNIKIPNYMIVPSDREGYIKYERRSFWCKIGRRNKNEKSK